MKNAIRAAAALMVSAVLVVILVVPAFADTFDLEVSVVLDVGGYSVSSQIDGLSRFYSDNFLINGPGNITIIPKNQSLPSGIYLQQTHVLFSAWNGETSRFRRYQDDYAYYFEQLTTSPSSSEARFWNNTSRSTTSKVIVTSGSFLDSDEFTFGWQYHFIPVTNLDVPLSGNYDFHITTDYDYSALILYSVNRLSDFGDLQEYFISESLIDLPVTSADRLFYDYEAQEIILNPDFYSINLPTTGFSYLFRNVPVGDYHINSAFLWQKFDNGSYTSDQLVFPFVNIYDDTQGQAQSVMLDIWDRFEDGEISGSEAISQLDTLTQMMIESSDDPSVKTYWITYQQTIENRILNTVDTSGQETMRAAFESSQDEMDNLIEQLHVDKPEVQLPDLVDQGIDGSYIKQLFNPIYNNGFINAMMILAISFGIIGYILYGRRA